MSTARVAALIINYNGASLLRSFLPSICALAYPNLSIYVVDNASTDDSIAFLSNHYPEVHVIKHTCNLGFAEGYNSAIAQVSAEYYLLLNNDVWVPENLVAALVLCLETSPERAVCQPKILDYNKKDHFEYAGAAGGLMDRLGYPFARGRIFKSCEQDTGQYDDECEIFWAGGACMMIKAKYFHDTGGFWNEYFMLSEEVDLCWRIKMSGNKVYYTSAATVYHVGSASLGSNSPYRTYLNFRNNWIMLYRNMPKQYFRQQILPARLLLDLLGAAYLFFKAGPEHSLAVIKALVFFFRWRHPSKRLAAPYHYSQMQGTKTYSVITGYFFQGKKKYTNYKV